MPVSPDEDGSSDSDEDSVNVTARASEVLDAWSGGLH